MRCCSRKSPPALWTRGTQSPLGKLLKATADGREQRFPFHNLESPFTRDVTHKWCGVCFKEEPMGRKQLCPEVFQCPKLWGRAARGTSPQKCLLLCAGGQTREAQASCSGLTQPGKGRLTLCACLSAAHRLGNDLFPNGKIAPIQLIEWAPQKREREYQEETHCARQSTLQTRCLCKHQGKEETPHQPEVMDNYFPCTGETHRLMRRMRMRRRKDLLFAFWLCVNDDECFLHASFAAC